MASRWTTSGIDWDNIQNYRTSWVIDELYMAFKEKEALLNYYRRVNGGSLDTVGAWDSQYYMPDSEKIYEIMANLKEWLRYDVQQIKLDLFDGAENVYYFWASDIAPDSMPVDLFKPLAGLPYYTYEQGGDFENLLGLSMQRLRDFPQNIRIDRDLLELLWAILINLKKCHLAYYDPYMTGFGGELFYDATPGKVGGSLMDFIGEDFGSSEQDHINAYNNYVSLTSPTSISENKNLTATGFKVIVNERNSSTGNQEVGHINIALLDDLDPPINTAAGGGLLSSKNIRRDFVDTDFSLFRYYEKDSEDSYSGFTYDTFNRITYSGNTCFISEIDSALPLSAFPWDSARGRPAYADVTVRYIGVVDISGLNISEYSSTI